MKIEYCRCPKQDADGNIKMEILALEAQLQICNNVLEFYAKEWIDRGDTKHPTIRLMVDEGEKAMEVLDKHKEESND